jgi:hypothetical protein
MEWASRIMAVSLEMVLPGLAGWWLDSRVGWNVFTGLGFIVGLIGGVTHLIVMTRPTHKASPQKVHCGSKTDARGETVDLRGKNRD